MASPANPVIGGLLNAFSIANLIRRQAEADRDYALRQQETKYHRSREARSDELADLEMRHRLATDPRLEALAPGQGVRPVDVSVPEVLRKKLAMPESFQLDVPAENTLAYGGERYAVRGREEMKSEALDRMRAAMGIDIEKAAALDKIRREGDLITLPEIGTVPRSVAPALVNAEARRQSDVETTRRSAAANRARVEAARIRGQGKGEITAAQRATQLQRLETQEAKLSDEVRILREIVSSKKIFDARAGDLVDIKDEAVAQQKRKLALREAQLRAVRRKKVEGGFTTAEEAGLVEQPQPAAKKATKAQVSDYARQKKITLAQAMKEFGAAGYEVE